MLLAEDLLLLLTDDGTGRLVASGAQVDVALGGAELVDLTLAGRVDVTGEGEGRRGRLVVRDATPLGDPLLDEALATVRAKEGKKPEAVVGPLGRKLRARLYERLAQQGVVRAERGRLLGVFPVRTWPAADAAHERQLRDALEQALVTGLLPQERVAALVSLLRALRCLHKVVRPRDHRLSRRELDRRAKEIAAGDWGSAAVRKAIDAMASSAGAGA